MYIHFKTYTGTMNHVSIYNADGDFFFQPKFNINEKVRPIHQVQQFLELIKMFTSRTCPAFPLFSTSLTDPKLLKSLHFILRVKGHLLDLYDKKLE